MLTIDTIAEHIMNTLQGMAIALMRVAEAIGPQPDKWGVVIMVYARLPNGGIDKDIECKTGASHGPEELYEVVLGAAAALYTPDEVETEEPPTMQ